MPILEVEDLLDFPSVTHENEILIYSGTHMHLKNPGVKIKACTD